MIVARKPRSELRALARDLVTNRAWGTADAHEAHLSFGFLLTVWLQEASPSDKRSFNSVGFIYAPLSATMPRSINGLPMFTEASFVHVNDMDYLFEEIERMQDALGFT